jgi:hypothetical protein
LTPPQVVSEITVAARAVATVATATSTMTPVRRPRRPFEPDVGRFVPVILPPSRDSLAHQYGADCAADLAWVEADEVRMGREHRGRIGISLGRTLKIAQGEGEAHAYGPVFRARRAR